jgi:hypothetical protein
LFGRQADSPLTSIVLNITFFLGAAQSNLTRLQAGHFDWRHSERLPLWKNVLATTAAVTAAIWA